MFALKHVLVGLAYCVVATFVVVNVVDFSWIVPPSWEYLTPLQ